MTINNKIKDLEEGKPYLDHKNAILSAPVRHMFMIATIWYLMNQDKNKHISIMEIGTWFGASALSWAQGLKEYSDSKGSLTCVDAWKPFFDLNEHQDNSYVLEMEALLESDFAYNVIFPIILCALRFICVPIIGWVPTLDNFSENSKAPHKL